MSFTELATKRRSVRRYQQRPVETEKIERCLEAARLAPSASNSQPWHYVVIREDPDRLAVARHTRLPPSNMNKFAASAPAMVVVLKERPRTHIALGGLVKGIQYNLIDVGISAGYFCLQAAEEGLGTCMIGWFNQRAIKKILGAPKTARVALVITLGYPEEKGSVSQSPRKPMDAHRSYERYRGAATS